MLAAGGSTRMGQSKAVLKLGKRSFLELVIRSLRAGGCGEVVVVVPPERPQEIDAVASRCRAHLAENGLEHAEQVDSLRVGLHHLRGFDPAAVVVAPVDVPGFSSHTVRALISEFRTSGAGLVLPVHGGQPGHPTLFARALFGALMTRALAQGARTVIERHAGEVAEVAVADPGVLRDVDTPAELEELRESLK